MLRGENGGLFSFPGLCRLRALSSFRLSLFPAARCSFSTPLAAVLSPCLNSARAAPVLLLFLLPPPPSPPPPTHAPIVTADSLTVKIVPNGVRACVCMCVLLQPNTKIHCTSLYFIGCVWDLNKTPTLQMVEEA